MPRLPCQARHGLRRDAHHTSGTRPATTCLDTLRKTHLPSRVAVGIASLATLAREVPGDWKETQESWVRRQLDSHLFCSSQKGQLLDAGALIIYPICVKTLNLSQQAPFNSQ